MGARPLTMPCMRTATNADHAGRSGWHHRAHGGHARAESDTWRPLSAVRRGVYRIARINGWLIAAAGIALAACAPATHVLVGQARPPIRPDQVTIYSHPPSIAFQEIAVLDASDVSAFGTGGQKAVDKVIERLRVEAAKLGANGVILEGFSDTQSGSIGTGVGSDSYGNHSAVGVGVGGSIGIFKKIGHGDAIYIP